MQNNTLTKIIMGSLALHLLYSNASLLIKLNDLPQTTTGYILMALLSIFAISYSILTVTIIMKFPKRLFFIIIGIIDGTGIFIKLCILINHEAFVIAASIYFSLYTMLIVITSGFIAENKAETIDNNALDYTKMTINKLLDLRKSLMTSNARLQDENKKQKNFQEIEKINDCIANGSYKIN